LPQSQRSNPQSAIIEWYHNTAAGLEQGFTIESAPGERRDGERLRVGLALEGELRAEVVEGGKAVEFRDHAGQRALRYDHLVVRDGAGRELEARMAAPDEEGEVWLEVDDREAVWPVTLDPTFTQQQKLEASDAASGDYFGYSVAISGDTVVVSAQSDDGAAGVDQGSAYAFVRNGGVWTQQQKLVAQDAAANDFFGASVAISGETIVVGSPFDVGAAGIDQGSAYVFVRSGGVWTQQQKLVAQDAAGGDYFGISVAIGGETVMISASFDAGAAGITQGSAYMFITAPTNAPPVITAANVSRTQGLPASIGAIAQANDAEDALNTLTVTVNGAASATASGVTVSSISVDASGQVTASVGADCNASNASFTLRITDSGGLFAETTLNVTVTQETAPPLLTCPSNVVVTLPPNSIDTQMVVNYPAPSATDNCTASPTITTSQASGTVFPVGLTTVNVTATDAANNQATCSFTVTARYNFSGFFQPVDNPPTVNVVKAGRAIPVKFSLSGDKGLNIFAAGYPVSQQIACSDGAPTSEIEQTVTANGSSLSYDAESDQYNYVWKTEESWAGTCRQLIVRLNDGGERVAFFKFK
jgi:hypothetical protein